MKVLVTGGAGFIGSHLCEALLAERHQVTVMDTLSHGHRHFIPVKAKFVQKDLVRDDIQMDFAGVEAVFHLAADPDVQHSVDPQSSFDNNAVATFRVLEACRQNRVPHVLFASSSAVYGEAKVPTPETHSCKPISNYGASKVAGEAMVLGYGACYGMRVSILRFANIFGEHSYHGVMHDFFQKLKQNPKQLEILGNGRQEKSYLHVDDAVAATLAVWKKQKEKAAIYNVGSAKKITVNEIAKRLSVRMGVKPKRKYTGGKQGWVGDVPQMFLHTKKLRALGWKETVPFDDGLKRYLDWLQLPKSIPPKVPSPTMQRIPSRKRKKR